MIVNSSGAISVRKPNLPRLIPNIGTFFEPNSLEQLNIVPSPPIAIIRSALEAKKLVEEVLICLDLRILLNDWLYRSSQPLLKSTSSTCWPIESTFLFEELE